MYSKYYGLIPQDVEHISPRLQSKSLTTTNGQSIYRTYFSACRPNSIFCDFLCVCCKCTISCAANPPQIKSLQSTTNRNSGAWAAADLSHIVCTNRILIRPTAAVQVLRQRQSIGRAPVDHVTRGGVKLGISLQSMRHGKCGNDNCCAVC